MTLLLAALCSCLQLSAGVITGELKKWHPVTITFDGPSTSETATPNPFTDYRLQVTFTKGSATYVVPGYYAADGNAVETSATSGDKWRVHFTPDQTGTWSYSVSFRQGTDVAINTDTNAGTEAGFMNGETGSFEISASDKTGRDHRGAGRLSYVGEHYLQYGETGAYFVKAGADAPENTLAYEDFDEVPNRGNRRKSWSPHAGDYSAADAGAYTWQGAKGSELLGAVKYLSDLGVNAFSFLTLSLHGDDENVFPHLLKVSVSAYNGYADAQQWADGVHHDRFDVSRLAQWDNIFAYGDKKGMYMHFKTMETENDALMDNNSLGRERKIYYRELIARFGYHLALNWNLGEETVLSATVLENTAQFIKDVDPYDHIVVFHTYPGQKYRYNNHLGSASAIDGASLQTSLTNFNDVRSDVLDWVEASANAGKKWVVALDESGGANIGVDQDPNDITLVRSRAVWNTLMAGGAGFEYYYGYGTGCTDLTCQDHRTRELKYKDAAIALDFFRNNLPFQQMVAADNLTGSTSDYVFAKAGVVYTVYLPNGGSTSINLPSGGWEVRWFNPRMGSFSGSPTSVIDSISAPGSDDWVALIQSNGAPCNIGAACDDGNPATINDVYDINCNCIGTPAVVTTICYKAVDDAYLQGSTRFNNNELRVEQGNRVSYLKFNLSSLNGNFVSATLRLTVGSDAGNGPININAGNSNLWTETNLSASNAPGAGAQLAQLNTTFSLNNTYTWPLNYVNIGQVNSFVLTHISGNDVSFRSDENTGNRPELCVTVQITNANSNPGTACDDNNLEIGLLSNSEIGIKAIQQIKAFPNPFQDKIQVELPINTYHMMEVFNTNGQLLARQVIAKDQGQLSVDFKALQAQSTQLYMLRFVGDGASEVLCVVRQ